MKKLISTISLLLLLLPSISIAEAQKATVINLDTGHRKEIFTSDKHAFDGGYLLETSYGYKELSNEQSDKLGYSVVSDYFKYLSQTISATASVIPVTSMETTDGHTITVSDLGSKVFLTLEPQNNNKKEIVMCTGISSLTFTGCTRGLAFSGTSTTAVTANKKTHQSGTAITISNVHYVLQQFLSKEDDNTVSGDIIFSGTVSGEEPVSATNLTTKNYVDNVTNQGAATGTETVQGIWEGATQAEIASGTTAGTSGNLAMQSKYATSSAPTSGNYAVITEADGNLNQGLLDLTEDFSFSGIITNNGTSTGFGFSNQEIITTTGTSSWEVPEGINKVKVKVIGGGGNGGSSSSIGDVGIASGGGGGGYCEKIIDVSAISSVTLTVGVATAASSFGTFCYGLGGVSGTFTTGGASDTEGVNGGVGGTASGGDINISGQTGGTGLIFYQSGTDAISLKGGGGKSYLGNGVQSSWLQILANQTSSGINASSYGDGGGGCADDNTNTNCTAGTGSQGVIIIEY